jgi:ankyrin repeat protein
MTGFGETANYDDAAKWLCQAALRGESWAKSAAYRLLKEMGHTNVVDPGSLEIWSVEAAHNGSWTALESLLDMNSQQYQASFSAHRSFLTTEFANRVTAPSERLDSIPEEDEMDQFWLHKSIATGNLAAFELDTKRLLGSAQDLSTETSKQNHCGDSPLMVALRCGYSPVVHKLLDLGADVTTTNCYGENCLHLLSCLDEEHVLAIAERLFEAGADWTAEAHSSSIMGDLEPRLQLAGCPLVRAVTWNKGKILDILLQLESKHSFKLDAGETKVQQSNLRRLVALACRMNYAGILRVIAEHRPKIFDEKTVNDIGYWIDGRRHSLAALAISGCISAHSTSGFDYPNRFWRLLNARSGQQTDLWDTLAFLRSVGVNFIDTPCGGERNALFFATRHGREDAVKYLLSDSDPADAFRCFGKYHLQGWRQAYPLTQLGNSLDTETLNHFQKTGLVGCIRLSINQCHKVVFRSLLQWRKHEALNPGPMLDMFEDTSNGLFDNCLPQGSKGLRPFFPRPAHRRKAGEIHEYQREFWPLKERPTYVVTRLFIQLITRSMWHGPRTYDGTLNYSLLYMTLIALAPHRDVDFA